MRNAQQAELQLQKREDFLTLRTFLSVLNEVGDCEYTLSNLARMFENRSEVCNIGYLYKQFLGRAPENSTLARRSFRGIKEELGSIIQSTEFRMSLAYLICAEFPELRRDLFIHPPRVGGTTIRKLAAADASFVVVESDLARHNSNWSYNGYLVDLARTLFAGRAPQWIHIGPHLSLDKIIANSLCRGVDRIYMGVREPNELMLSWLQYVLSSINANSRINPVGPSVQRMVDVAGCRQFPTGDRESDKSILSRIVEIYLQPNPLCRFSGSGQFEEAHENLKRHQVKIYVQPSLGEFLESRDQDRVRLNFSTIDVKPHLTRELSQKMSEKCAEDVKLYDAIIADSQTEVIIPDERRAESKIRSIARAVRQRAFGVFGRPTASEPETSA